MDGERFLVIEGKERGKRLSVDDDLLIGRVASDDEGRLGGDPEISRRHAYVSRAADGRLTIEDLGSANGTFVNDERIDAPRKLDLGDVVRVGKTVLKVTGSSGARPENAQAPTGAVPGESAGETAEAGEVLVVTAGPALGRRLTLSDELVIGRGASGEGRLSDDLELSRRHARVARDADGQLTIEDLGSANGTFVDGERVRGRRVLKVGDSVQIGSTTLKLTDVRPAPAPPAAAPLAPAASPPAPARRSPAAPASWSPAPARRSPAAAASAAGREGVGSVLPLGSVFAGCRVEEVIGHGAMGVVYRGEELALQRPVALKLILAEHSQDERFRERFRRESQIAASIDHPNVIPIFDAGEEDGVLFIMMRLVEGTDARALIAAEGRIEPLRAARIVRQVGAALDAAHARGMLHRDVKPSNVLLARGDHVYLSDFGLAKRADSAGGLTRHGTIVARAEYVSPEQILNQRVDARADIYALGCLLFEALTGEVPFANWQEGPGALAHLNAPRPSPTDLRPDLPRKFDEVVHRAMAKEPSERYPSAGDLGQAALVAAGDLRRASPWSVVARGAAASVPDEQTVEPLAAAPRTPVPEAAQAGRPDALRWAIALAGLAIVAVGMLAALSGISSL
jgi:pSer/pThr/pTyr-binding forkhead associated (FHA) protein